MNTFNCAKPLHDSSKLPPLPKRNKQTQSLKSTITSCGINSACPAHNQLSSDSTNGGRANGVSNVPGISFPYDSVSLTRELFRGFLLRTRDSLTVHERNFLEDLVEDGQEDDLNNAMLVLSDRNVFFHPKQWNLEQSASHFFGCPSPSSRDDSDRSKEEEETMNRDECSTVSSPGKTFNKENLIEYNVEVVNSEHGAVILEGNHSSCTSVDGDGKNDAGAFKDNGEELNNVNAVLPDMINDLTPKKSNERVTKTFTTPTTTAVTPKNQNNAYLASPRSRSVPQSARLGTPHRRQRVEERRQSVVHSSMWKAHKQGLSLTPASSFQSVKDLNRILSLKRRILSGQRGGSPNPIFGRRSRNGSRAGSRTSSPQKFQDNAPQSGNKVVRSLLQRQQQPKYDHTESLSSMPSLRHAHHLRSHGDSGASDTDSDEPVTGGTSRNVMFGKKMSSSTLGSDGISERDMGSLSSLRVSFSRLDYKESDYFDSSLSSIPGLDLAHSIHSGTFAMPYNAGKGISPLRRASRDSFKTKLNSEKSLAEQGQKSSLLSYPDVDQESSNVDESLQSFPSLQHGQSIDDSMKSIPTSIYPSQLSEDTSNVSVSSLRSSRMFRRESSQWSRASSVTLNSLTEPYELEQVTSNVSVTSTSSLRHKAPIRPTRNPSPLVARPKLVQRAMSDGVLPPRRDMSQKLFADANDVSKNTSDSTRPKLLTKRKSLASRFDVLETIESVDERNKHNDDDDDSFLPTHKFSNRKDNQSTSSLIKPIIVRKASEGSDNGFGVEISGINDVHNNRKVTMEGQSISTLEDLKRCNNSGFYRPEPSGACQSPHSVHSESAVHLLDSMEKLHSLLDASEDDELTVESGDHYDSWHVLMEDDENDFNFAFKILGTSADDVASTPHVLSPPLMESLHHFLPYAVSEQNFFMKYSLLRDGASFISLLQNVRGSTHTLVALETTDGEVFGSFTSAPWRKHASYFGSGECFLWRMKKDRKTLCKSVLDQAILESDIEVFAWTGANYLTQLCTDDKIALGGGSVNGEGGFGLIIEANLLIGQTNRCATFGNPPLSNEHQDGSSFEIVNLEVWTMTPCNNEEEAQKLELGKLFLEANRLDH